MSRYLVTGATGFLGAHLALHLATLGHEVVALARTEPKARAHDRITPRRGDVLDAGSVRDAAAGCEGAFHCAGKVSRDANDAGELQRVHVEGTKVALDACRDAGVRRVVVASTSGIVAVSKDPDAVLDEGAPEPFEIVSRWPYYRSKLYAEHAAFERNRPGFEVVCVNPTLLLGPGDDRLSSTSDVKDFLEGKFAFTPAGGLSIVDVRDAAEAMRLAMERGRPGARYLVAAANMTIQVFFDKLSRISGVDAPRFKLPKSVGLASAGAALMRRAARHLPIEAPPDRITAEMGQHFWYVDASRARNELGWSPRDPMDTLSETVADLERRGVVWPREAATRT